MTAVDYAANYLMEGEFQTVSAPWGGRLGDLLVFIIPASQLVEFDVVGRLFAPDVILLALLPVVLLSRAHFLKRRLPRTFIVLGLVWFAGQVTTDFVRSTPFEDYARGWAMIAFTLTNFSVLYVLLFQNARRIVIYTVGSASGNLLIYFLHPSGFAVGDPWKFGYGFEITAFLVLLATLPSMRSTNLATAAILIFGAALNVYNGARSLGGACFLVGTYLLMRQIARARREQGSPRLSVARCLCARSWPFPRSVFCRFINTVLATACSATPRSRSMKCNRLAAMASWWAVAETSWLHWRPRSIHLSLATAPGPKTGATHP